MDWERDFEPGLTPEEYRNWTVSAFHDMVWQNAIAVRALSTHEYVRQVVQIIGRDGLANVLKGVMSHISVFERNVDKDEQRAETTTMNLAFFRDAEKRLRAAARYCLDNASFPSQNITIPRGHPTEAIQHVERDPVSSEITGSRTVYKFE